MVPDAHFSKPMSYTIKVRRTPAVAHGPMKKPERVFPLFPNAVQIVLDSEKVYCVQNEVHEILQQVNHSITPSKSTFFYTFGLFKGEPYVCGRSFQ